MLLQLVQVVNVYDAYPGSVLKYPTELGFSMTEV